MQLCADWHREGHGGNIRQVSTRHIQRPLACAHAELSFRPQHMSRGGQSSQPQQLAQQVGLPGAFLQPPGCSPRFILTSRTRRLDFSGGSGRPEDERHFHSRGQPEACDGGGPRVLQGRHAGAHFKYSDKCAATSHLALPRSGRGHVPRCRHLQEDRQAPPHRCHQGLEESRISNNNSRHRQQLV